jgi:uncharacterized protein (TIGR00730 family)
MGELKRVCVFCGSSAGEDTRYLDAAARMGRVLAEGQLELVYGGSRVGLMGRLADTVLAEGGEVTGVIPEAMVHREVAHRGLTHLRIVASMHERKAAMADLSDAFVALPGGLGTLEELCEMLTWGQLGLHRKPCGVLDANGYYGPLIGMLDHMVQEGFLSKAHRGMLLVDTDPETLLDRFRGYEPPYAPRWIERDET